LKKEVIFYPDGTVPWPRAVKVGNWVSIVAAGVDCKGNVIDSGFEEQLDYTYRELKGTLDSLGSSIENIMQMTIYCVGLKENLKKLPKIRKRYIADNQMPVVAAIGVTELAPMDPPLLVEITCSAIIVDK
jgi:enamine deaminase RidA (YjgF/YER057c/UK114 family)